MVTTSPPRVNGTPADRSAWAAGSTGPLRSKSRPNSDAASGTCPPTAGDAEIQQANEIATIVLYLAVHLNARPRVLVARVDSRPDLSDLFPVPHYRPPRVWRLRTPPTPHRTGAHPAAETES